MILVEISDTNADERNVVSQVDLFSALKLYNLFIDSFKKYV